MTKTLIEFWIKLKKTDREVKSLHVLDNSVGDGRFLTIFSRSIKEKSVDTNWRENVRYYGLDIDPNAKKIALRNIKNLGKINLRNFSIKVGNALIGYINSPKDWEEAWSNKRINKSFVSFYNLHHTDILRYHTPFHWFKAWPDVIANGGWDIILGNPPYGINYSHREKKIYRHLFQATDQEIESYILFIERSIQLLRKGGLLGLVVPSNLATNLRYQKIRQYILRETRILKIVNLDKKIFSKINVEPCIIFLQRFDDNKDDNGHQVYFEQLRCKFTSEFEVLTRLKTTQSRIYSNTNRMLIPSLDASVSNLLEKIRNNSYFLKDFVKISRGIELGFHSQATSNKQENSSFVPLIAGRSIQKFYIGPKKRFIRFDSSNKSIFKDYTLYTQPKLMLRRIGHEIIAAYDQDNLFCLCDVYILILKTNEAVSDLYFLEAILNSSLISFYLKNHFTSVKKIFPKLPIKFLKEIPIRVIKDSSKILNLVDRLHKIFEESQSFSAQYFKLMKNLDNEIFKLYELSPDEQIIINEQFKDHNKNI